MLAGFNKSVGRFTFFLASSFFMFLGVNLSFFFFGELFFRSIRTFGQDVFKPDNKYKILAFFFVVGSIMSTLGNLFSGHNTLFSNSLRVLPNYMYWGFILILFITYGKRRVINQALLFKRISQAVIVISVYYFLLQSIISDNFFFKKFGPNNYAFLLICFTPYVVYFFKKRYSFFFGVMMLGALLSVQLIEQRRAGFILVLFGGLSALFIEQIRISSFGTIFRLFLLGLFFIGLLQLPIIENAIKDSSERIHSLIYEGSDALKEDRSFLIRLAMVEKGASLFNKNPLFGVGLNNFTSVSTELKGNFEGAEFVIHKKKLMRTSSHNSYINIMAEGGLFLLVPFLLIFVFFFIDSFRKFDQLSHFDRISVFSITAMLVHFYFMNAVVNSLAWFNIAIALYAIRNPAYEFRKRIMQKKKSKELHINPV